MKLFAPDADWDTEVVASSLYPARLDMGVYERERARLGLDEVCIPPKGTPLRPLWSRLVHAPIALRLLIIWAWVVLFATFSTFVSEYMLSTPYAVVWVIGTGLAAVMTFGGGVHWLVMKEYKPWLR